MQVTAEPREASGDGLVVDGVADSDDEPANEISLDGENGGEFDPNGLLDLGYDPPLLVVAEGHSRGEGGLASAGRLVVEDSHGGGHFGENTEPVMPGQHAQSMHRRWQKPAPCDPPDKRLLLLSGNLRRGKHSPSTGDLGQHITDESGHFVDHLTAAARRIGGFENCLGIDTSDPLSGGIEAGLMVGGGGSVGHAGANASVRGAS